MRFIRIAIQIASIIFTNCSSWIRQNLQQLQLICCSKNNIVSQSKWHDIHSVFVLNEACDLPAVRMQLCSLILCAVWYCLHLLILFFLFNLNCTFTSLYILRLEHALLILYFLSLYSHWEWWHFFKKRHLLQIWFQCWTTQH